MIVGNVLRSARTDLHISALYQKEETGVLSRTMCEKKPWAVLMNLVVEK